MGWRGLTAGARTHNKKLYPRKRHFFVMKKYIEEAKQEEKDVPDLLEAIMRSTSKDHLSCKRRVTAKFVQMSHFGPEITKIRVSTFWIPEI